MDKHDRPYVCKKSECSSLQGFTYSGGLLRHQREVHHLHGGAKLKLFCHVVGCKRSKHTPFTRRENLAEHLRRVHKLNTPEPNSPPSTKPTLTFLSPKTEEGMKGTAKGAEADATKEVVKQDTAQDGTQSAKKTASLDVKQNGRQDSKPKQPRLAAKPAKLPVDQTANQPFALPVSHSMIHNMDHPINQFIKQPISQGAREGNRTIITSPTNQTFIEQATAHISDHTPVKSDARQDIMKIANAVVQPAEQPGPSTSVTPKLELIAHETSTDSLDVKKRKRDDTEDLPTRTDGGDADLREEAKRLKIENDELRKAQEVSNEKMARMEKQISELVSATKRMTGANV